jgi:hypothetical protein
MVHLLLDVREPPELDKKPAGMKAILGENLNIFGKEMLMNSCADLFFRGMTGELVILISRKRLGSQSILHGGEERGRGRR